MRRMFALLSLLLLLTSAVTAQSFEGKVVFANKYQSRMAGATDEQFNSMMGPVQEYFVKGGSYRITSNGTFFQSQLYVPSENRLYNKMSNSPSYFWIDGASNPDEVMKAEINKGVVTVLGHLCDEIILTCKSGIQKYYFSPKFLINAKLYEKHKFGNWFEYLSRANAVPLKIYIENQQFSVESIATSIEPMALNDSDFKLPAGAAIEKSPY
jgi:hypothetical protein